MLRLASLGASRCARKSHLGAIRVPSNCTLFAGTSSNHLLFADDLSPYTFLDPGNAVYKKVRDSAWPDGQAVVGISAQETIGDLVEAFFGYHWFVFILGQRALSGQAKDFVDHMEIAFFWTYFSEWP